MSHAGDDCACVRHPKAATSVTERNPARMRFRRILVSCTKLVAGGWRVIMKQALAIVAVMAAGAASLSADTLQGRWKLIAAEDIRADGSVARLPWGRHPVGSIVVEAGACMVQIMSGDTPAFSGATP